MENIPLMCFTNNGTFRIQYMEVNWIFHGDHFCMFVVVGKSERLWCQHWLLFVRHLSNVVSSFWEISSSHSFKTWLSCGVPFEAPESRDLFFHSLPYLQSWEQSLTYRRYSLSDCRMDKNTSESSFLCTTEDPTSVARPLQFTSFSESSAHKKIFECSMFMPRTLAFNPLWLYTVIWAFPCFVFPI